MTMMGYVDAGDTTEQVVAREDARHGNGQFGQQNRPESLAVEPRENAVEKDGSWFFPPQVRTGQDLVSFWCEVPIPEEVLVRFTAAYEARVAELPAEEASKRPAYIMRSQVRTVARAAQMASSVRNWPASEHRDVVMGHMMELGNDDLSVEDIATRFHTDEIVRALDWVDPAEAKAALRQAEYELLEAQRRLDRDAEDARRAEDRKVEDARRAEDRQYRERQFELQVQLLEAQQQANLLLEETRRGVAQTANIGLSNATGNNDLLKPENIERLPHRVPAPPKRKGLFG